MQIRSGAGLWLAVPLATYVLAAAGLVHALRSAAAREPGGAIERATSRREPVDELVRSHPRPARRLGERWLRRGLEQRARGDAGARETLDGAAHIARAVRAVLDDESPAREAEWGMGADAGAARRYVDLMERVERAERRVRFREDLDGAHRDSVEAAGELGSLGNAAASLRARHVAANARGAQRAPGAAAAYAALLEEARASGHRFIEGAATNNLSYLEESRGRFAEALRGYRRTRAIGETHGLPRLAGFGALYAGNLYHRLGMHERSSRWLGAAERRFREIDEPSLVAVAASNLGASLHRLGARSEAVRAYRRALAYAPGRLTSTHLSLAELLDEEGNREAARAIVSDLVARKGLDPHLSWGAWITLAGMHGRDHRWSDATKAIARARSQASALHWTLVEVETDVAEATLHLAREDLGAAEPLLQRAAAELDRLRQGPEFAEERIPFLNAQAGVHRTLLRVRIERGAPAAELFELSERFRSRALVDSLEGGAVLSARADADGEALGRVLPRSAPVTTLARARAELTESRGLLHLTTLADRLILLAVSARGEPSVRVVPSDEREMARLVKALRASWSRAGLPAGGDPGGSSAAGAIAALVLEPVAEFLRAMDEIVVVADDELLSIPWAALPFGGGRLLDAHSVLVTPSASAYVRLREGLAKRGPFGGSALIVAGPGAPGSRPLPEAEREAETLAKLFQDTSVHVLVGREATESRVREAMIGAGVVHFGAHARLEPGLPLSSSIALARDAAEAASGAEGFDRGLDSVLSPAAWDGALTGYEVLTSELARGALVTLAACESLAPSGNGRGVAGLARAFFEVGASTVVATHWPVDDRAARELMERFYDGLGAGEGSRGRALARAQRRLARGEAGERFRHPYYWAGFVMLGAS